VEPNRYPFIRYTLTRYFADNGLTSPNRRLLKVNKLVRLAERTGYKRYLASEGSEESYLTGFFDSLGIKLKDPTLEPGLPSEDWLAKVNEITGRMDDSWSRDRYPLSTKLWRKVRYLSFVENGYRCQCCGATNGPFYTVLDSVLTVDHIKPRKTHPELTFDVSNTQILCRSCNSRKGTKDTDYRRVA
jgi:5-methylcytosine-specific restriction endonuclease McrA